MNLLESYRDGRIYQHTDATLYWPDGREEIASFYSASYLNRSTEQPYQACTASGQYVTIDDARAAIDDAENAQAQTLAKFDCMTYTEARQRGVGTRWPKPAFWPPYDEVLTVAYVGRSYILSTHSNGLAYLSMGNADCEYACHASEVERFVRNFERPVTVSDSCHYCGMEATREPFGRGFFGEQVCRGCGGK